MEENPMKICVPTIEADGMNGKVSEHFGSAPYFTLVDLESGGVEVIENQNQHHSHGQCHPLASLAGKEIEAVVCGGMGRGAIQNLNSNGIKAYLGMGETVNEVIQNYQSGKLKEITMETACGGHGCH